MQMRTAQSCCDAQTAISTLWEPPQASISRLLLVSYRLVFFNYRICWLVTHRRPLLNSN